MKLKSGMYVRTPLGISKYLGNYDNVNNLHEFDKLDGELWTGDIADVVFDCEIEDVVLKASPCIIDLIEVGDYVNGSRVEKINCNFEYIDDDADTGVNEVDDGIETVDEHIYFDSEIETILTKEQFDSYEFMDTKSR